MLATRREAVVCGQRTYGKGTSQALVHQPDGHAITFTVYTLAAGSGRGDSLLITYYLLLITYYLLLSRQAWAAATGSSTRAWRRSSRGRGRRDRGRARGFQ